MTSDSLHTDSQARQNIDENAEISTLYWPKADEEIRKRTDKIAKGIYASPLPSIVREWMDKELNAIHLDLESIFENDVNDTRDRKDFDI